MSELKLPAASGGGSISIKGPASSGSDVDLLDTSGNLNITGQLTCGSHLNLGDGDEIKVGAGEDLLIYHTSDQNYLKSNNGRINLRASEVRCEKADGSEVLAKFIADGACELRYNDSAKLTTTNTGITVTGSIFVGTNGEGISFESSNNNGIGGSNITFDDYEEGTYNPTWSGITNYTSGYNTWYYTKIGRLVNIIGQLRLKTTTNDGTDVSFTLPFTPAAQTNAGNTRNVSIGPTMHQNIETGSGGLVTYVYGGNAYGYFYNNVEDGNWWILESQHLSLDDFLYVNFTYIT